MFLSTRRLRQGIRQEFAKGPPGFLPQLRLVTELATEPVSPYVPPPVQPIRRRLELSQAVAKLLEGDERFGSRSAIFHLADSLASLLDEMHAEGVDPVCIRELDISEHSEHWARSLEFIDIIEHFWGPNAEPDQQARQRHVVERLVERWDRDTPDHPVIVAGSTGSRGPTRMLMEAVAQLPQGAIVVPCFDFVMPQDAWDSMTDSTTGEDHPQYRLKCMMDALGLTCSDVSAWRSETVRDTPRNRLISLALRPAPVTDQWLTEGPALGKLAEATSGLTLLEAQDPRQEAVAIALCMREAVEDGKTASLVTPDRNLARQVGAALKRWGLVPFNNYGESFLNSLPGRLLHSAAGLLGENLDPVALVALLKNALVHDGEGKQLHLRMTKDLEMRLRNRAYDASVNDVVHGLLNDPELAADEQAWCVWLRKCLDLAAGTSAGTLLEIADRHEQLVTLLSTGSQAEEGGMSRQTEAGRVAVDIIESMKRESDAAGQIDCPDYVNLFTWLAARKDIWQPFVAHPLLTIQDTIDARMQSPDLVIAAGLNDGTWPRKTGPDPWLNREMRQQIGLLLPDRITGLLAHDFQQAVSAERVVLSRCVRNIDTPMVPSRWLSRLVGLLSGLKGDGEQALAEMRERGNQIIQKVRLMEEPRRLLAPEQRPHPRPPVSLRPNRLSVTAIRTLSTNPYEIYARYILRLRELNPLGNDSQAHRRGTIIHNVLRQFAEITRNSPDLCTAEALMELAEQEFNSAELPAHARRLWLAQLGRLADEFVEQELGRRQDGASPWLLEASGEFTFADLEFTLTARVDRVDRCGDEFFLYDYKSGAIPNKSQINRYDKQLPLTAMLLEHGGFQGSEGGSVSRAAYLGVGRELKEQEIVRLSKEGNDEFEADWDNLQHMIATYRKLDTAYVARRNLPAGDFGQAYHHLARFGEWDDTA